MTAHDVKRRERIAVIVNTLNEAKDTGKDISKEKLICMCCMKWGCTRRLIIEYLGVIEHGSELTS